jgi:hypothetical protein
MTSRPSTAAPILAVLAIVLPLAMLGLYAVGYFGLGECFVIEEGGCPNRIERTYSTASLATVFEPAAKLDTWLTGRDVVATCP